MQHIIEAEQDQYKDKMDKRTLNRILDWLKREGKVKIVKTLVPTEQGDEEVFDVFSCFIVLFTLRDM